MSYNLLVRAVFWEVQDVASRPVSPPIHGECFLGLMQGREGLFLWLLNSLDPSCLGEFKSTVFPVWPELQFLEI